ncbi:MAG: glyceraldehyde 3-phosphate dehydrogenase NAD-binding domain-containing protein, partial [Flavobacteriales bacterium]
MHPLRIGINGFGRIGRALTRILINDDRFQIVGINDPSNVEVMAHLLRYDSVHGKLDRHVEA